MRKGGEGGRVGGWKGGGESRGRGLREGGGTIVGKERIRGRSPPLLSNLALQLSLQTSLPQPPTRIPPSTTALPPPREKKRQKQPEDPRPKTRLTRSEYNGVPNHDIIRIWTS